MMFFVYFCRFLFFELFNEEYVFLNIDIVFGVVNYGIEESLISSMLMYFLLFFRFFFLLFILYVLDNE